MVASYVVVEVDLARGLVVALGTGVPDLLVLNLHRYTVTVQRLYIHGFKNILHYIFLYLHVILKEKNL